MHAAADGALPPSSATDRLTAAPAAAERPMAQHTSPKREPDTSPKRKRGMASALSFLRRSGAAFLLLVGLLGTGCNDATQGGGVKARPAVTAIPDDEAELRARIDNVRAENVRRYMNTRDHAAWQLVHGILAYQDRLQVDHVSIDPATGSERKQRVPALKLLLEHGDEVRGFTLREGENGTLATEVEGGSKSGQGHPNQWLGYLLVDYPPREGRQANVTKDTRVIYHGPAGYTKAYTIADMIRAAKMALRQGDECGWSLIGLTAFPDLVPLDEPWDIPRPAAKDGQPTSEIWSIERILEMECGYGKDEGFHTSSCGGTHRLIGLSLAVQRYQKFRRAKGLPDTLTGGWAKADEMVRWGVERIRQLQQEDGAFSAQWLQRAGISSDVAVRIRTTGHCLEFLSLTLPKEELAQDWVTRAAVHLCELFEQTKELPLDCGATYHALHGLQIYREKRWGVPQ